MTWPVARVGDLADQVRGVSYAKREACSTAGDGLLPILRAGNITDDGLKLADLVFVPSDKVAEKQLIRKDDIVIAASSGSLDVVGKAARADRDLEAGFGAFCKVLRPHSGVEPRYFAHFFKTPQYRRRVSFVAAGANINNLRNRDLDDLEIPLPPLAEQKRIAAILDAADALRAKRRESIKQLDALIQSTFIEMFGDPVTNPMGWNVAPLGSVVSEIYRYPSYYGIEYIESGIPEVRGELIRKDGTLETSTHALRFIGRETAERFPRTRLSEGDLVMSVRGTVGKVGLVPSSLEGANITANLMKISPRRETLNPVFFWKLLSSEHFQRHLTRASSSTTIATIKAPVLKAIPIAVPPKRLQDDFAGSLALIEKQHSALISHEAGLQALFFSLQSRAFAGEL